MLILLMAAIGCGGEADPDGIREITVLIWKPNNPGAWDVALERFHADHPGVRARLDIQPRSTNQFHDVLTQRLKTDPESVDVFLMDVIWPPGFASAGWAAPLDDRFPSGEREEFFEGCIEAVSHEGQIWGVPFNTDSGLLYYRKDLLEERRLIPPRTWAEMIEQIEAIRSARGDPKLWGYSAQFSQYEGLICNLLEFVHSNGGDLLDPEGTEAIEAIRFVRDRIVGDVAPRGVLTYLEQESLDLFKSGGAVFHRNWPYACKILNDPEESTVAGKVGIAPLPTFRDGMSTASLGGWSFGICAASRHPDEAWAFVEALTSPEMQEHFAVEASKAPARKALYRDEQVLQANPHFGAMLPVFETATPRPRSPIYARISNALQPFLHEAIARQDSDIPALAREAARRIRKMTGGGGR
jgi:multiple sugar transport system substrate-binding protein